MALLSTLGLIFLTILIIFIAYMSRNFLYWRIRGVKQITPLPILGNLVEYFLNIKSPGDLIKGFYVQNSKVPYVGFYAFDQPCLLLIDIEIIKTILVNRYRNFSEKFMRSSEKDPLSNKSLPFLNYSEWNNLRKRLGPAFSPGKLKNDFHYLKEVTVDLDNYLNAVGLEGSGNTIDVKEMLAKYTTDIVGLTGFGLKLNSLSDSESEFRKFGKMMFGDYNPRRSYELTAIYLTPPAIKNFFDYRFFEKRSGEFFKKEFEKILIQREKSGIIRNDLVDTLIHIKNHDESISLDDVISQAIVLFTAGFDTTSTVMSFCLFELASNLDVQIKLRSEIIEAIEKTNGEISYEMVITLPFLENVILETLRLHPTVPTIDRIATEDYTIEETGLVIQKGTPIFISLTGLHYDSKHFSNPKVFDPENFLNDNRSKNPAYMPFGIGPRSCPAMRQGLMQVKYGIIHIISKFYVTLSSSTSVEVDSKVYFTSGKEGLFLNLKKIDAKKD